MESQVLLTYAKNPTSAGKQPPCTAASPPCSATNESAARSATSPTTSGSGSAPAANRRNADHAVQETSSQPHSLIIAYLTSITGLISAATALLHLVLR